MNTEVSAIYERIEYLKNKTEFLLSENPELKVLEWHITDVPYKVFDEFRKDWNSRIKHDHQYLKQIDLSGKMYCRAVSAFGRGAEILIWTVPVKIVTTYEVEELVS